MSKKAVSEQVGDASCLESEHVCTSRASFASLVPPTAGVQRGEAHCVCHQAPNPKSQEGTRDMSLPRVGGVPQVPPSFPESGGKGVE